MRTVTLVTQGQGLRVVEVQTGTTLADFAASLNLQTYEFEVDNTAVVRSNWASFKLDNASEIFATVGAKGA